MYAFCVVASCLGAVHANTFATSRLIYASANEGHLPKIFGVSHSKYNAPVSALLLFGVLCSVALLVGNLKRLILFQMITEWSWYFVMIPR
jgi:amino acid transporter